MRLLRVAETFIAVVFLLNAAHIANADTLNVSADTTWRAIGPVGDLTGGGINNVGLTWEAANTGWNTSLAFDDSDAAGWTNAIEVVHPNVPLIRYWVDGTETMGSSPAYFRKQFVINGIPTAGSLDFVVDDDAKVYINGSLLIDDSNSLATYLNNVNVSSALQKGLNLIAIKAQDQQGGQSINFDLAVTYRVPEPSALVLVGSGLVLLGFERRRYLTV